MPLLLLLILLIISSNTYISYISFLLCMIHLVLYILILGNYYLALVYLIIYIGSIAILFIYILMVLSIVGNKNRYGYLLFILPFLFISLLGTFFNDNFYIYNILTYSYSIYTELLIPIGLLLLIAMIFAIKYI